MQLTELLHTRRSVRRFRAEPIFPELIDKLLETIRTAPSAGNFQAYEIYIVGSERMAALAAATFDHPWIAEAPMALVFCTNAARCQYPNPAYWAQQDAAIAATFAHLALADMGLASCWVGAFIPAKISELLQIPEEHVPLALLPFGYANETPEATPRRECDEFVHWRE
jgi:nitroreductase